MRVAYVYEGVGGTVGITHHKQHKMAFVARRKHRMLLDKETQYKTVSRLRVSVAGGGVVSSDSCQTVYNVIRSGGCLTSLRAAALTL